MITEAPQLNDEELKDEHKTDFERDYENILTPENKQEDFEDLEVYANETIRDGIPCSEYYFVRDGVVQLLFKIDKKIVRDFEIKTKKITEQEHYILFSVDQNNIEPNRGLARRAVLNYFSKKLPHLISGENANKKGKPFFAKLLPEAIQKGFKVVLYDPYNPEQDIQMQNFEDYWENNKFFSQKSGFPVDPMGLLFKINF